MLKNTSFIVVNCMANTTLTNISILHEGDFMEFTSNKLSPGEASQPIPFESDGNNDYWDISFFINGKRYVRYQKECGLRDNDQNQITVISLYEENFSVVTPQSKGCFNNHYDSMNIHTSANINVINQTGSPLHTEVNSKTDITSSINYFDNKEIPANTSSTIIGIQSEGLFSQSNFEIGMRSKKEGSISFNLGSKSSGGNTKVTAVDGSPAFAGFVAARSPFGFGTSYDLHLYAGQTQASKLINSFFEANAKAIQSYINANGYTFTFGEVFSIKLNQLQGLENSSCTYSTLSTSDETSEANKKKFKFTTILNNQGSISLDTIFNVNESQVHLNNAYVKNLQILLEGNLEMDLSNQSLAVELSTFKVYLEDYSIDFSALAKLFPVVAVILKLVGDITATPANLAGIINSNEILGITTNLNQIIIDDLNMLLDKKTVSANEFLEEITI